MLRFIIVVFPDIRKIFTRLCIDNNVLNVCKARFNRNVSKFCYKCTSHVEDVEHFLLNCSHYKDDRDKFYKTVTEKCNHFVNLLPQDKLKFIINLDCPQQLEGSCCLFVNSIYRIRESM